MSIRDGVHDTSPASAVPFSAPLQSDQQTTGSVPMSSNRFAASGALAAGASAAGAIALGALAMGAVAVGAFAIGRLAIGRARIRHLDIDELTVRRLRVTDDMVVPAQRSSSSSGALNSGR